METYLTFVIDKEYFALPVTNVLEVLLKQQITSVPKAPEHILGIINFRGDILPVIDTRKKFNLSNFNHSEKQVIIVFEIQDNDGAKVMISATADSVSDVIEINEQEIKAVPELGLSFDSRFISGAVKLKNHFILLLNIEKVFSSVISSRVESSISSNNK